MTKDEIIQELRERIKHENENVRESQSDIRTPGFNQNLGARDALQYLLDWIKENDRDYY